MKALIGLLAVVVVVVSILMARARYQTLAACTELENRLDETARPTSSMTPVTDESVRAKVHEIAQHVQVSIHEVTTSFEPLTQENAGTVSTVVAQATAMAAKLRGHQISGSILTVHVTATASGFLSQRKCDMERKFVVQ